MLENSKTSKKPIIIGTIILLVIGFLIWFLIKWLLSIFNAIPKEVAAPLIAASATIIVSVLSIVIAKYYEKKRAIELEHRNKKIPIYEDFVEFLFKLLMSEKIEGKPMSEKEMLEFMSRFTQKLVVWGSDDVINQWSKCRNLFANEESTEKNKIMFQIEELLIAIRKDTGHKIGKYKKGDILRLFINDIDKHL
ncbi:hypothetical protein [Saccharibacillus sacchari]|uniref:hypothetical protein n=1 Tax=Saccharibacillus sacchari TaxID=456493 RepID=UPI0005691596|nr:hypothetical protein [Saccharibacillus sacchari]